MEITKKVQYNVMVETELGRYMDAFYFDEGSEPAEEELMAQAQERADNWVAIVKESSNPPEPTAEELQELIDRMDEEKTRKEEELERMASEKVELVARYDDRVRFELKPIEEPIEKDPIGKVEDLG